MGLFLCAGSIGRRAIGGPTGLIFRVHPWKSDSKRRNAHRDKLGAARGGPSLSATSPPAYGHATSHGYDMCLQYRSAPRALKQISCVVQGEDQ